MRSTAFVLFSEKKKRAQDFLESLEGIACVKMKLFTPKNRYFGFRGGWLTFWITVACGTDMTLFGYDQGVCALLVQFREAY